jgi:hypothetical protein
LVKPNGPALVHPAGLQQSVAEFLRNCDYFCGAVCSPAG